MTIDASPETLTTDYWYLVSLTAADSLVDEFESLMTSAGVAAASAFVGLDRKVHLSSSGTFTVTWTSTVLRDFLGFTANLAGNSSYDAPNVSPLLFSAGWPVTKQTRPEVSGYPIEDLVISRSADGTEMDFDTHNTQVWDEFAWDSVFLDRVRETDAADTGGTWFKFRETVLAPGFNFHLHEDVTEDEADTSAVTLGLTGIYKIRTLPPGKQRRVGSNRNDLWNFGCEVIVQPEYA